MPVFSNTMLVGKSKYTCKILYGMVVKATKFDYNNENMYVYIEFIKKSAPLEASMS